MFDRIPTKRVGHVNLPIAGPVDARVRVLAGIRFQMQRRFPGPSFINRTRDAQWRPLRFRVVEHDDRVTVGELGHADPGVRVPQRGRDSL